MRLADVECDLCGSPLTGEQGSACPNRQCGNRARADDPKPFAPGDRPYRFRHVTTAGLHRKALKRTFKGIS